MQERIERIIKILDAKKAEAIEAIDMSGREYIAKCVIIATTMGERHAYSLTDDLKEGLKDEGEQFLGHRKLRRLGRDRSGRHPHPPHERTVPRQIQHRRVFKQAKRGESLSQI